MARLGYRVWLTGSIPQDSASQIAAIEDPFQWGGDVHIYVYIEKRRRTAAYPRPPERKLPWRAPWRA